MSENSFPNAGPAKPNGGRRNRRAKDNVPAVPAPMPTEGIPFDPDDKDGKKARDNAVTARLTKTKMCHFFERGKCASDDCRYAHSANELRQQPNLEKTKLCKTYASDGYCNDGENCGFAHGEGELRVTEGIYKTQMCHFFERGRCLKGDRCNHAHGKEDLRQPQRKQHGGGRSHGASGGAGGMSGGGYGGGASVEGGSAVTAPASYPAGPEMRSPLSPLPLAKLLGDPGSNNIFTNTPAPPPLPVGLHSPDLFSGMGLWTGMPWSPPAFAPTPAGMGVNGLGMPMGNLPLTPTGGGYQGHSLAMPSSAPPPGMAGALGAGMGMTVSPAPGLYPATVGVPEGVRGALEFNRREGEDTKIRCDLFNRLASLDVVCNSLATDVRNLTSAQGENAPPANNAPANAAPGGDAAARTAERLVHRI